MKSPFEYFCKDCHQLRLCLIDDSEVCGNCGSMKLIVAEVEALDKDELFKEYGRA